QRADRALEVVSGEEETVQQLRGLAVVERGDAGQPAEQRLVAVERVVELPVLAHPDGRAQAQRLVLPGSVLQDLAQQRRLPASVGPDEAHALAVLDLE